MKVLNNLIEVTKETKGVYSEIEKAYLRNLGCSYFFANEVEVKIVYDKFVILDGSNEDYQNFFMKYEVNDYEYKVYVDDLEKWQKCKVIGASANGEDLKRLTAVTELGTQLNRVCKFVFDGNDERCITDGCVYFWDKDIEEVEV